MEKKIYKYNKYVIRMTRRHTHTYTRCTQSHTHNEANESKANAHQRKKT